MRIDYRDQKNLRCFTDDGRPFLPPLDYATVRVTNLDTAQETSHCILADDKTGEYVRFITNSAGEIVYFEDVCGPKKKGGRANLKIEFIDRAGCVIPWVPEAHVVKVGGCGIVQLTGE